MLSTVGAQYSRPDQTRASRPSAWFLVGQPLRLLWRKAMITFPFHVVIKIWVDQLRSFKMVTPRYLASGTSSRTCTANVSNLKSGSQALEIVKMLHLVTYLCYPRSCAVTNNWVSHECPWQNLCWNLDKIPYWSIWFLMCLPIICSKILHDTQVKETSL